MRNSDKNENLLMVERDESLRTVDEDESLRMVDEDESLRIVNENKNLAQWTEMKTYEKQKWTLNLWISIKRWCEKTYLRGRVGLSTKSLELDLDLKTCMSLEISQNIVTKTLSLIELMKIFNNYKYDLRKKTKILNVYYDLWKKNDTLTLHKELHTFDTPTCQVGPAW